jgi:magnesium-protoporphyrin IX monomethyl ester (oxidative) cyclase
MFNSMAKQILLIQPNYKYQKKTSAWGINPPMGLTYIAAVLEKNNVSVKILDANALDLSPDQVIAEVKNWQTDIVGVSIMTPAHNFAIQLAQKLPKNILSVAGGPQATSLPEVLLKEGYKVVVRGEGEYTFLDLVLGKNLNEILGISFRQDNQIKHNLDRPSFDPNNLPMPARHLLINNGVNKPYYSGGTQNFPWARITSSRGCPHDCNYCNKLIFGRNIRFCSPEYIMNEIDFLVRNYGVKEISFSDDCFNFDIDRAKKILDLIISRDYKINIRFSNGLRADKIDEEFLEKAKKAGCRYIAYGIESGSQEILNKIPKGITLDTIRRAIALTKRAGIQVTGYFMIGLLWDTRETMQQTIDFAKELDLDVAQFTLTTPYPGTRMWNIIQENGGEIFLKDWDDFHHTTGKCLYFMPRMADPKTIETMYKKAHRDYYFRLSYLFKHAPKFLSWQKFKLGLRGLKAILYTQKRV